MGDAAPSRTARSWLVAVVATTLLAATSMVAVAGPAAAATLPDTVSSAPNLSLQACPDGTVLLADSVIPSTAAGSSFTFSKNGLQFPPPPALGYGLVVNDGAGHVTFSSPTIPVAAVALNVTDSQGTAYATALGGWASPVTSGDISSVVAAALSAAGITSGSAGMYFCTPALGLSTTAVELGATVPGTPATQQVVHLTNTTGVLQQLAVTCTDPTVRVSWFSGASFQAPCPQPSASSTIGFLEIPDGESGNLYVQLSPTSTTTPGQISSTITLTATPVPTLQGPLFFASQSTTIDFHGTVADTKVTPLYVAEGAVHLGSVPAGAESPFVPVTITNGSASGQQFSVQWAPAASPFDVDTAVGPNPCGPVVAGLLSLAAGSSCTVGVRPTPGVDPAVLASSLDSSDNVTGSLIVTVDGLGPAGDAHLPVTWFPPVRQVYGAPAVTTVTTTAGTTSVPVTFGFRPSVNDAPQTWPATVVLAASDPQSASGLVLTSGLCTFTDNTCTVTVSATLPPGQSLHGVLTLTTQLPGSSTFSTATVDLSVAEFHPANDDLAGATDLTTVDPTTQPGYDGSGPIADATGDTTGATSQPGESLAVSRFGRDMDGSTVWYHVVPKVSGLVEALSYDFVDVNVYSSVPGTASSVQQGNDPAFLLPNSGAARGRWLLDQGRDYWVQVGTQPGATPGPFTVTLVEQTEIPTAVTDLTSTPNLPFTDSLVPVGPATSRDTAAIIQVPSGPDRVVRLGVRAVQDNLTYIAPDPTITVWEFADPTLTAIPANHAGGVTIDPEAIDPLGAAAPLDYGLFAPYRLRAGHSYVVEATNPDTTTPEWVYPWYQSTDVSGPPPATGPVLSGVTNVSVPAVDATGADATYTVPTATYADGTTGPATCTPVATHWPVGVTTVTCTATNPGGATSTAFLTVTVTAVAPRAPHVASVTATTDSLTATWAPPVWDGGSSVTSYTVTVRQGSTVVVSDVVTGSTTTDTLALPSGAAVLGAGTELTVAVVATTAAGDSPPATATTFLAPAGAAGSASGSNGTPASVDYTAGSTTYTTSATGTGGGTVVVSHYPAGTTPTGTVPFSGSTAPLFDVVVDHANPPATVTISTCPAPSSGRLWWFDAVTTKKWLPVVPAATLASGCLTFTATSGSKPSVTDLSGTVFAVADPPASGTLVAADTTVATASSTTLTATVVDAGGVAVADSSVLLSDGQTATTDSSGKAVFTVSSSSAGPVTYSFTADGVDVGASVVVTYGAKPTITAPSPGAAITGTAYAITESATGSPTWSATGLPSGLSIDAGSGTISGKATAAGTSTAKVTATNAYGSDSVDVTIHVYDPVSITTSSLADGIVGADYSAAVVATGDSGPATWSATGLPDGLTIDPGTGGISGKPTSAATSTVTVTATGPNTVAQQTLVLHVYDALAVAGGTLPDAGAGTAYSATVTATGGKGPVTWLATGLPSGLTIGTTTGVISGTPTAAVTNADVVVTATDALQQKASAHWALTVYPGISVTAPGAVDAEVGVPVSLAPSATGGKGPLTWSATGLPGNLSIDKATGAITGSPTSATSSPVTVTITASGALGTGSAVVQLTVHAALAVTTASLPNATAGSAYSTALASSGGLAPVGWSATGLPSGLTVSGSTISGTTSATGPFTVAVTAIDALGATATRSLTLTVGAAPPPPPPSAADLGLALTSSTLRVLESGTITATVRSTGTAAVTTPVTVKVTLPGGLVYRRASGSGWSCTATLVSLTGQVVTCTRTASLAPAASSTVSLSVVPLVRAGTVLTVTGAVSTTSADPTPADDSATVSTTVRRG